MSIREFANTVEDKSYKTWMLKKADWLDPTIQQDDEIL